MSSHSTPAEGATCMSCWDDVTSENYVEFKSTEKAEWQPSGFCEVCIGYLLKSQWEIYTNALAKTTCKAEQRRLLKGGPPINLKDSKALPCPDDAEIHSLWYMSDGAEHSAKLEGSLVGEARQKFWDEQAKFFAEDEPDDEATAATTETAPNGTNTPRAATTDAAST